MLAGDVTIVRCNPTVPVNLLAARQHVKIVATAEHVMLTVSSGGVIFESNDLRQFRKPRSEHTRHTAGKLYLYLDRQPAR